MSKAFCWKAVLCIVARIKGPSEYGIINCQRGTMGSISLEVFADADYVSKAVDRQLMSN